MVLLLLILLRGTATTISNCTTSSFLPDVHINWLITNWMSDARLRCCLLCPATSEHYCLIREPHCHCQPSTHANYKISRSDRSTGLWNNNNSHFGTFSAEVALALDGTFIHCRTVKENGCIALLGTCRDSFERSTITCLTSWNYEFTLMLSFYVTSGASGIWVPESGTYSRDLLKIHFPSFSLLNRSEKIAHTHQLKGPPKPKT